MQSLESLLIRSQIKTNLRAPGSHCNVLCKPCLQIVKYAFKNKQTISERTKVKVFKNSETMKRIVY
jgi:hypothetical protein